MILEHLLVGALASNCFVIGDEETKTGAIIDPGGDEEQILKVVQNKQLQIKFIIATHGHFDHVAAAGLLKDTLKCDFLLHKDDVSFVRESKQSAQNWGINIPQVPDPDKYIEDENILELGSLKLLIIHTPGHSPGGISIYLKSENILFSGDTLFSGSVGRTDFMGGSMNLLVKSIRERLYTLPDNTVVYTGHGESTTIGHEKMYNVFVSG